jgi:hypothetical protein
MYRPFVKFRITDQDVLKSLVMAHSESIVMSEMDVESNDERAIKLIVPDGQHPLDIIHFIN